MVVWKPNSLLMWCYWMVIGVVLWLLWLSMVGGIAVVFVITVVVSGFASLSVVISGFA